MSARDRNNPADTFYWKDYDNDKGLRLCSFAAQGLWMRMLCLMAAARPIGFLQVDGADLSPEDLATLCGKPADEVAPLLAELERRQVFSRNGNGTIYNRRMVSRAKRSKIYAENGRSGAAVTNGRKRENGDRGGNSVGKEAGNDSGKVAAPLPIPLPIPSTTSATSPPEPSDPERAAAVALIREFDQSRTATFGEEQARPYPAGNDFVTAQRWRADGVTVALARAVFDGQMAKLKGQGRQPPSSLAFFDRSIREALVKPPPIPCGTATVGGDELWTARVRRWQEVRFWHDDWGPEPSDDDCRAPKSVIAAAGIDQRVAAPNQRKAATA